MMAFALAVSPNYWNNCNNDLLDMIKSRLVFLFCGISLSAVDEIWQLNFKEINVGLGTPARTRVQVGGQFKSEK